MKVADGVAMLEIRATLANGPGVINPTLVWDGVTAILVDTGLPGMLPQFRAAMEAEGVAFARLGKVIVTHHDTDHLGSLAAILKESPQKVEVLAHAEEKPYIQAEKPPVRLAQMAAELERLPEERRGQMAALFESLRANYGKLGAAVDHVVADGERLPACGGITVIHTPGHTPGHICLYLEQSKTLVAGDALNVEGGVLQPPRFTHLDPEAAARSLRKLTGYDCEAIICYHGGLWRGDVNRRIAELAG